MAKPRPYRQTARAEATERTRRSILDAGQHLFLVEGRYDLPLDAVAARAGVTTRTVLRHFGSREGLIEAGIAAVDQDVRREREPAPGDVGVSVRRLVDHYERIGDATVRMLAAADRFALVRRLTDEGKAEHRRWAESAFAPDLRGLDGADRDHRAALLATVTDVHVWELLRRRYGMTRERAEAGIRQLVEQARGALP